jgi:hypothetical protein
MEFIYIRDIDMLELRFSYVGCGGDMPHKHLRLVRIRSVWTYLNI